MRTHGVRPTIATITPTEVGTDRGDEGKSENEEGSGRRAAGAASERSAAMRRTRSAHGSAKTGFGPAAPHDTTGEATIATAGVCGKPTGAADVMGVASMGDGARRVRFAVGVTHIPDGALDPAAAGTADAVFDKNFEKVTVANGPKFLAPTVQGAISRPSSSKNLLRGLAEHVSMPLSAPHVVPSAVAQDGGGGVAEADSYSAAKTPSMVDSAPRVPVPVQKLRGDARGRIGGIRAVRGGARTWSCVQSTSLDGAPQDARGVNEDNSAQAFLIAPSFSGAAARKRAVEGCGGVSVQGDALEADTLPVLGWSGADDMPSPRGEDDGADEGCATDEECWEEPTAAQEAEFRGPDVPTARHETTGESAHAAPEPEVARSVAQIRLGNAATPTGFLAEEEEYGEEFDAWVKANSAKLQPGALHSVPTLQELRGAAGPPPQDLPRNPEGRRVKLPFRAGCMQRGFTDEPQLEKIMRYAPRCSQRTLELYRHGFKIKIKKGCIDAPIFTEEYLITDPKMQALLDETTLASLRNEAVELFDRHADKGVEPWWVSPSSIVKKSDCDEMRHIFDHRLPNELQEGIKQRYESIRLLHTMARKGYKIAKMDLTKMFYSCNAHESQARRLCFTARIRRCWLEKARTHAASRLKRDRSAITSGEITYEDWQAVPEFGEHDSDADDWESHMFCWTCVGMGLKLASPTLIGVVRCILRELRAAGLLVIHYVDDFLLCAPNGADLDASVNVLAEYLHAFGFAINWGKCMVGIGGHDVLVFTGIICDMAGGRFYAQPHKLLELQVLIDAAADKIEARKQQDCASMLDIAKITGRLVSMNLCLHPAKLFTRGMFTVLRASTAAEYKKAVTHCPESTDELLFWAKHLGVWAKLGCSMFPRVTTTTLKIVGDASPSGAGVRFSRPKSQVLLATGSGAERVTVDLGIVDGAGAHTEYSDAWTDAECECEQVVKEMRVILLALGIAMERGRIDRDQGVDIHVQMQGTAAWMENGLRFSAAQGSPQEQAEIISDNKSCEAYFRNGGGRYAPLRALLKMVWRLCLEACVAPRVVWAPGASMLANGVDALSRLVYQPQQEWLLRPWVLAAVLKWAGEQLMVITARSIASGRGYQAFIARRDDDSAPRFLCLPSAAQASEWVGHCLQQRASVVLLVAKTHQPWMAMVHRAKSRELPLGPAYKAFVCKGGRKPRWPITVFDCDFGHLSPLCPPVVPSAADLGREAHRREAAGSRGVQEVASTFAPRPRRSGLEQAGSAVHDAGRGASP